MSVASERIPALILAGGVNKIPLFEDYQPDYKALLEFHGKCSIQYVIDALRASNRVGEICIVGPSDRLREVLGDDAKGIVFIDNAETLMDNVYRGLAHFSSAPAVLTVTADTPLITPAAVQDFLTVCANQSATYRDNLYLSVVPQRCFTGKYSEATKPLNRFRDLAIGHGNMMLITPSLLENSAATRRLNALYNARKSPISSALAVGMRVGLSYVLGVHLWHLLTVENMARIASSRFGIGFIPIFIEHPGVVIDVDEPADYQFVNEMLSPVEA